MLFETFEVKGLAHFSYAVGCPAAGRIAIVDPKRDVDTYLAFAREKGLAVSHVLETHIHADYASGACELARKAGAPHCVSRYDHGESFETAFPHTDLADGDAIELGSVRLVALHTPGHTPEHLSFLVFDTARSRSTPMLLLSGDFLFVGSLGRPDLLGEQAKRGLAERLFDSTRKALASLPDGLEIHPAHGAGSMCGAGLSGRPTSTLGFERIANPYLDPDLSRSAFVERILASVPPFPPYYRRMKQLNAAGAPDFDAAAARQAIDTRRFSALAADGHAVIDVRAAAAFGDGHVPRSFGIGLAPGLATWAAWVVPYDTPLLLVAENADQAEQAARWLARVGLDSVRGHLDGGFDAWRTAGMPVATTRQLPPAALHDALKHGERYAVVDVRAEEEFRSGHVPGAIHVHGGFLAERLDQLPRDVPLALICGSGYRSTVAASVLERAGLTRLVNVPGGMQAWRAAGLPVD